MRASKWLAVGAGLGLICGIAACSRQEHGADASMAEARVAAAADTGAAAGAMPAAPAAATAAQLVSSAATYVDNQRRFIRTARARFEVDDVYRATLAIEDEVAAQGGFVTDNTIASHVTEVQRHAIGGGKQLELSEYALEGEMTVRVPSDKTQEFLRAIAKHIRFLDMRSFNARDAQFELLRQQLAWQRAQDAQQEIGDVADTATRDKTRLQAVQARADARGGRDEALIAQKEFEDRVAFSTIQLNLRQAPQIRTAERVDVQSVLRDHRPGFFRRLGNALQTGWQGALDALVVLSTAWPLWLAMAVGGWLLWRWRRKRAPAV